MRRRAALVIAVLFVSGLAISWLAQARLLGETVLRVRGPRHELQIVRTRTPFPFCWLFCEQAYAQVDGISGRIWKDLYEGRGGYETGVGPVTWMDARRVRIERVVDDRPDVLMLDVPSMELGRLSSGVPR